MRVNLACVLPVAKSVRRNTEILSRFRDAHKVFELVHELVSTCHHRPMPLLGQPYQSLLQFPVTFGTKVVPMMLATFDGSAWTFVCQLAIEGMGSEKAGQLSVITASCSAQTALASPKTITRLVRIGLSVD